MNKHSKKYEILSNEKENRSTGILIPVQKMVDFFKMIGLNIKKTFDEKINIGDHIINNYSDKPELRVVWDKVKPEDKYTDIINKRSIAVNKVIFPKDMKKINPIVSMKGFNLETSRGGYIEKSLINRILKGFDGESEFIVRTDTSVTNVLGCSNITTTLHGNFLHITFLIMKTMDYTNISDTDFSKYCTKLNVIYRKIWPTTPDGEFTLELFSIYGNDELDTNTIESIKSHLNLVSTTQRNGVMDISITLHVLGKEEYINEPVDRKLKDHTADNSNTWIISAYETY